jgi:uncharacterized protein
MRVLTLILSLVHFSVYAEVTPQEFYFWRTKTLAEKGNVEAQYNLGVCYEEGRGVEVDYTEAFRWYKKAAEQGDSKAQYNLSYRYYSGEGVVKDYVEAVKWCRMSAMQGNTQALNNLGVVYERGDIVAQDLVEAYAFYNIAGLTFDSARTARNQLEKKMTLAQIEAGQKRTKELQIEIVARAKAEKK